MAKVYTDGGLVEGVGLFAGNDPNALAPVTRTNALPVNASNIVSYREAFEVFPGDDWSVTQANGDIVAVDGNAAGSSYLVISKSPWTLGAQSYIESLFTAPMPLEMAFGAHMSQRTIGQQFVVELVSTDTPAAIPADLAIASISQSGTTLTANMVGNHNLRPGQRIGIYGCSDSRMNYSALVVATTPTPQQWTATAGPFGTIPTLTAGPFASGYVTQRPGMLGAPDGSALIFENNSATNASLYVKSAGGDLTPMGGTISGNHSVACGSTASVQAIAAALTYAFRPTTEYRLAMMSDRVQWQDVAVDTVGQASARATMSQVAPDPTKTYKVRIRGENYKSLTAPVGAIVSVTKNGSNTATVLMDRPHGLTANDWINAYGVRDSANFANLSSATQVASVVDATSFTVIWGSIATAMSYGGMVARVNGGQVMQGVLVGTPVQSATLAGGILTLVGSAAWSGASFGDYVDPIGVNNAVNGASLGVDGAWRIRDMQTTNLILEPVGSTIAPADFGSTNCGGVVVRRTDLRVSFLRLFDFERLRIEALSRPYGDVAGAATVVVQNGYINVQGSQNNQGATVPAPVLISGYGVSANPTTGVTGRQQQLLATLIGALISKPYSIPEADWRYTGTLTANTAVAAKAAGAAGIKNYVTGVQVQNTSGVATTFLLQDGATTVWSINLPASMAMPVVVDFPTPVAGTAATALNVNCGTTGANVLCNVQGYQAP